MHLPKALHFLEAITRTPRKKNLIVRVHLSEHKDGIILLEVKLRTVKIRVQLSV